MIWGADLNVSALLGARPYASRVDSVYSTILTEQYKGRDLAACQRR